MMSDSAIERGWICAIVTCCHRYPLRFCMLAILVVLILPLVPLEVVGWLRLLALFLTLAGCIGLVPKFIRVLRRPKPFLFSTIALLFGIGLAYGLLEVLSLAWLKTRDLDTANPFQLTAIQRESLQRMLDDAPDYYAFSSSLGWVPGPNRVSEDGLARSNAAGFRAEREYAKRKPANVTRVICFGNSYVHCDEVSNAETWPHYAEVSQRGMEFLNFGVGGYGVTQSLIRYEETALQYETDAVILGCMTDDLRRSLNVYYPFRLANPADAPSPTAMPYASLDHQGELVIHAPVISSKEDYVEFLNHPQPKLKEMAKLDPLFKPPPPTPLLTVIADRRSGGESAAVTASVRYLQTMASRVFDTKEGRRRSAEQDLREQIYAINCAIFERFAATVKQRGDMPLILWFPSPKDLENHNNGKKCVYQQYLDHLKRNHIPFVDIMDWLRESYRDSNKLPIHEILKVGHFSAATNQKIGKRIAAEVLQMIQPTPSAK